MADIAKELRYMHAMAANSCDPQFNRAILKAAAEIDRLRAALKPFALLAMECDRAWERRRQLFLENGSVLLPPKNSEYLDATVGDCRHAAAVLNEQKGSQG